MQNDKTIYEAMYQEVLKLPKILAMVKTKTPDRVDYWLDYAQCYTFLYEELVKKTREHFVQSDYVALTNEPALLAAYNRFAADLEFWQAFINL